MPERLAARLWALGVEPDEKVLTVRYPFASLPEDEVDFESRGGYA